MNCPFVFIHKALARPSLSERVANSSPQLAATRHEQVIHWCGSLRLAKPSLSEQFADVRYCSLRVSISLVVFADARYPSLSEQYWTATFC
ncbi:hypothetical protein L195_g061187 [Trifolium pratense]|uniref:Uncharacterized protein n=1 Tax=Trifolium pratense TaxID=57577 RepID=A0A2K3K8B9_TRIPR|nr:hypothetical protein L195_g061187 [Trifolium pratense]